MSGIVGIMDNVKLKPLLRDTNSRKEVPDNETPSDQGEEPRSQGSQTFWSQDPFALPITEDPRELLSMGAVSVGFVHIRNEN